MFPMVERGNSSFPPELYNACPGATEISPEENYLNSTRETRRGTNLYTSSFFPENLKRRLFIFARSLLWMALFSNKSFTCKKKALRKLVIESFP